MHKVIGTAAPLRALMSRDPKLSNEPRGSFATALPFIDWLSRTGQKAWQMLPLSETQLEEGSSTTRVPSPYKGYGIGLDPVYLAGWPEETPSDSDLEAFRKKHIAWLPDYAVFCALRENFGTDQWTVWPENLRDRHAAAIRAWSEEHAADVLRQEVLQWRAHCAFDVVRTRAKASGIMIVGDLPYYVSDRSPLVWAFRACFDLATDGRPRRVSGVPDSPKAHYGRQVWGHPLYLWGNDDTTDLAMRVWKIRVRHHAGMYDLLRLDHAKGLFRFGALDPEHPANDLIQEGPGSPALEAIILHARSEGLELFAEDSGDWLDNLRATLHRMHVPGIRVLQHAYNLKRQQFDLEYAEVSRYPADCLAYTTTHDTQPLMGYLPQMSESEKAALCERVGVPSGGTDAAIAVRLRNAVLRSPAHICIVPLQDWLLTNERINVPGTEKPVGDANWKYRMAIPIEDLPSI